MFSNVKPMHEALADIPPDCSCQFVGKPLYNGAKGRRCQYDDGSCFHFDNPDVTLRVQIERGG